MFFVCLFVCLFLFTFFEGGGVQGLIRPSKYQMYLLVYLIL